MIKKLYKAGIIFSFIFIFLVSAPNVFASTLTLSPGSGNVPIGGTSRVSIVLNTGGEGINGVSAVLTYPADKLEVASISYGNAFSIAAEGSYGGGTIRISRGSINPVNGSVTVATINFRGKSSGSATVAFVGGSGAPRASDSSDSLNLGSSRGGVFNVAQGSAKSSNQVTNNSSTQQKQKITSLIISDVAISDISTTSATINWKTNIKADSFIEYGLEKEKYFLDASDRNLVTEHKIILKGLLLTPGLKIHYRISSKDVNDLIGLDIDRELQLLGYTVKIRVINYFNIPLKNTPVTLYLGSQTENTDLNGWATFKNVVLGKNLLIIKSPSGDTTAEIVIKDVPEEQSFDIKIKGLMPPQKVNLFALQPKQYIIGAVLVSGALLGIGLIIFAIKKK